MKTHRIKIAKDERVEICVRRGETPATACNGKRTGVRADLCLIGPVSLSLVVFKRPKQ
jgi:hypothetical protein